MEKGMSLVEILLVVATVGFLVLLLGSIPNSLNLVTKSGHLSLAKEIAGKQMESIRHQSYDSLAIGEMVLTDLRLNELFKGSGKVGIADCDPAICTNLEQIKTVTVTINWEDVGKSQQLVLETLVTQGGVNN